MTSRLIEQSWQPDLFCQRWREGRVSYRPAGEPFNASRLSVEAIDDATARAYVCRHHYTHSYPAARFRAGLFVKIPFQKAELVGVGVFSVPATQAVIPAYFEDLRPSQGVDLGRFSLHDFMPGNSESWTISRMVKLLRAALPEVRGLLAFCDPVERRDTTGQIVKPGHVGIIYRATNATPRGRSSARTLMMSPGGVVVNERMLSKIRLGESGERYALERLRLLGARPRKHGEGGAAYVKALREEGFLKAFRHPGCFAYTWRLAR